MLDSQSQQSTESDDKDIVKQAKLSGMPNSDLKRLKKDLGIKKARKHSKPYVVWGQNALAFRAFLLAQRCLIRDSVSGQLISLNYSQLKSRLRVVAAYNALDATALEEFWDLMDELFDIEREHVNKHHEQKH